MNTAFWIRLTLLTLAIATVPTANAAGIERPQIRLIDKFNVNVATGQVTQSMATVGIGGSMGLSHGISVHANELDFLRNFGYADKYWHEIRYVRLSTVIGYPIPNVLRVSDFADSEDFRVLVNGQPVKEFAGTRPPFTYVAIKDERNSLVSNSEGLTWTKPDGTIVKFTVGPNSPAGATGLVREIVYPNGFTITIDVYGLQSVRTNTGFQLKYLYELDHRPMAKPDNPRLVSAPPLLSSAQSGFSSRNPKYIKALNNAVEYCAPAASTCALANPWPTVTFDWPAGMPRVLYIGDNQSAVTLANGAVAKFDFRAYDLAGGDPNNPRLYQPGTQYSPRMVGFTPAGSSSPHYTYDFKNLFITQTVPVYTLQLELSTTTSIQIFGTWSYRAQTAGLVKTATNISKSIGYSLFTPLNDFSDAYYNYAIGSGIDRAFMSPSSAAGSRDHVSFADTEDGRVQFEATARNWPWRFEKLSGPWEEYEYTRGNLSKIKLRVDGAWRVHREAAYPATCTTTTRKTCNQPLWVKDPNGNITYYAYHEPSGQVASVTSPPDKHGISPQTRYEYQQKNARFFDGGSSKVDGSPIWLKTAEKSCINSAFNGSACAANDEIVTRFEYNHDNLLLTGMTVADPVTGTTRRTCHQYDHYGNRIGVTQPKANLASCE
jgi:hypothetical protein